MKKRRTLETKIEKIRTTKIKMKVRTFTNLKDLVNLI